jgi:hypothetical protein
MGVSFCSNGSHFTWTWSQSEPQNGTGWMFMGHSDNMRAGWDVLGPTMLPIRSHHYICTWNPKSQHVSTSPWASHDLDLSMGRIVGVLWVVNQAMWCKAHQKQGHRPPCNNMRPTSKPNNMIPSTVTSHVLQEQPSFPTHNTWQEGMTP